MTGYKVNVTGYKLESLIVKSKEEADTILELLQSALTGYGVVSVSDLFAAVGIEPTFETALFGWYSLAGAEVRRNQTGYEIYLPEAKPLEVTKPVTEQTIAQELASVFNRFSAENVSGTPDFVLAQVALDAVKSFNENVHKRANWRHETVDFEPWKTLQNHIDPMADAQITNNLKFKDVTKYLVQDALDTISLASNNKSDLDDLVSRLIHLDQEAKETYIREVMRKLDIHESDLQLFILEEYPPELESSADLFSNETSFTMTSKFRIRPKTKAELAKDDLI